MKQRPYSPIEAYWSIREACNRRPELRFKDWQYPEKYEEINFTPYQGYCYIATEVFCHLVPNAKRKKMKDLNHHFAVINDKVWDLTAEQFTRRLNYLDSYTIARKPLTKRATLLLDEVLAL